MADKTRYPQIPSTVWWGVRGVLNKTPNATLDEKFLSVHLGVQPAAAKVYISELVKAGILDEECKATPLAKKWRIDSTYQEAVNELIAANYPEGLRDVAPMNEGDRQKATNWFLQDGLGQGAAGNKAATYFMIGSDTPNEAPSRSGNGRGTSDSSVQRNPSAGSAQAAGFTATNKSKAKPKTREEQETKPPESSGIPLNVNVQIHISADAGSDQIESIFAAMRRYLYDKQNS